MSPDRLYKFKGCAAILILLAIIVIPARLLGRETSVSAGLSMQQEFDSNYLRTRDNPAEVWTSTLSPTFSISSRGQYDGFSLVYDPGYAVNLTDDTHEFEHRAQLSFIQSLSSRVRITASDVFSRSKDPERAKEAEIDLADKRGRRKYWVNTARLNGMLAYQQKSSLTIGYANNIFNDEEQQRNDYEKHTPSIALAQQLSERWQTNLAYSYTRADFEKFVDLEIHAPSLMISYAPEPAASFFGSYSYSRTEYAEELVEGYLTQNVMLGFSYSFDPNTSCSVSSGKYYVSRKLGADSDGYSYDVSLSRKYQKGDAGLSGKGGMEDRQFSAADEGLTKFWTAQGTFSYRFAEGWSSGVSAFFRRNKYIDPGAETAEDSFGGSLNLSCSFLRWYKFSLGYSFNEVNADLDTKDYQDHRVSMQLSAAGELWRW